MGQQKAAGALTPGSRQHSVVSLFPHLRGKWRVQNTTGWGRRAWVLPEVGLSTHEPGDQRAGAHCNLLSFQSIQMEDGRAGSLSVGCYPEAGILPHQWGTRMKMGSRIPTSQMLPWKYRRRAGEVCTFVNPGILVPSRKGQTLSCPWIWLQARQLVINHRPQRPQGPLLCHYCEGVKLSKTSAT